MSRETKLMSAREAIERFVDDGDTLYTGYTTVAFGLHYEVVRQGKRGLDVIGGSVGPQGTLLFVAGCANRTRSGYLAGALRPGTVQNAMASGKLRFEDYSNQAISLMLMAGALGIPFIPTRSFLGTDYLRTDYTRHPGGFLGKDKWALMESPFDGERVVLLPALRPDLALVHAHRADEEGNVQMWGHLGDARWACWAARKVIVSVEEIVPSEVIRSDPSRTVVPGFRVAAVVHMPYGAHPSGITGYYDFDYAFQGHLAPALRDQESFEKFAKEWIHGVQDHQGYIEHYKSAFGPEALESLSVRAGVAPLDGVRYSYAPQMRF